MAGLVCLAATARADSVTKAPTNTGFIEAGGSNPSSSVAMDAGWHASPGEDKHSALFRFDLSAYTNFLADGPGTLHVYSRARQANAATFNLYKLRQSAADWDGDSMGGPSTPDWDTIGATERQNAINDSSVGSGDFSSTGFVQVSVSQATIQAMIRNGAADRGVMLDNGNTQENSRVYLNGINWTTASERPYLVFPTTEAETVAPSDSGWIEDGAHASSRDAMDAGWHASPGEDKHSALLRFDLSAYQTNNWEILGGGTLYIFCREKQPNAVMFNLYKLRQSAVDWSGISMGGGGTPDWASIGATERQNAINDGPIGSGDFSGTGFREVSVSKAAIQAMISNGAADRGVMLDNGNTISNSRVYLNGIEWATTNRRPYMVFPAILHGPSGSVFEFR